MDASEVPEGIDPKNACRIEVNVNAYFSNINGKKVYNRGRTVRVRFDMQINFRYQLLDLLRASQLVKFLMIVGRREDGAEIPATVNMVGEDIPSAANVVEEEMKIGGFEWAEVPQYGETTAGPPMVEEEEKEHFMTAGCDPHGDEPTGVDEEWRYFTNVDSTIHDVQPVANVEIEVQTRKRPRPVPEFDTECVADDESSMIDDFSVPHTTYDKENQFIKEGDTFGDKDEFILTMRTYAIKNDFETRVKHSDTERYRARCADKSCDWKVFAKKLHGGNTFMEKQT